MSIRCVNVQPGELYLARTPTLMKTILGSCVGATFWSPRTGVGAICHGVLPTCPAGAPVAEQHRYVDAAIRYLIRRFNDLGISRDDLEIKLFGGADVLPVAATRRDRPTIGAQNCRRALEVLAEEEIRVVASDLGGKRGRAIHFDSATGGVVAHRLVRLADVPPVFDVQHGFPIILPNRKLDYLNYAQGENPRTGRG